MRKGKPKMLSLCRHGLATFMFALLLLVPSARLLAANDGLVVEGSHIADSALYDAAKKEGKLLLYATFEAHGMSQIIAKFQSDTGLSVEVIRLPTAEMFARATAEFSAHRLAADYVDTTDITLTQKLADRGILTAYKVPDFNALDRSLRNGDGKWYTLWRSLMGIGINTGLVKPGEAPTAWTDLLDPKWKNRITLENIDAGGSSFSFWFFLRQRYGIEAWRKAAALNPRIGYAAQPVATDLARGETAIAVVPTESILTGIAAGSPLKVILPPAGPSFGISGGITSVAPHPHAAQLWMNWMTSKHGGAVLASIGAYSIRRDAPTPVVPGVTMPSPSSIYNIRPSDFMASYAPFVKEWHAIFGH
jgi:iron(III) transport system substrate-binding protein